MECARAPFAPGKSLSACVRANQARSAGARDPRSPKRVLPSRAMNATRPTPHGTPTAPVRYLPFELRVLAELPRFLAATRSLPHDWPRGDGHAVVVIPGYGMTDPTTWALRRALTQLGYVAHGWGLGRNVGVRRGLVDALHARIDTLATGTGGPVSLVGWSLGGVYARELARARPERVRRVFTLGSPFSGEPQANTIDHLRALFTRRPVTLDRPAFDRRRPAPPVPCIAMHTKTDGVVDWRCSLEDPGPHTENVEVRGSHAGLVCNLEVLRVLAYRLPR